MKYPWQPGRSEYVTGRGGTTRSPRRAAAWGQRHPVVLRRKPYLRREARASGTFGILFSVFVVVIAALNLVLDFDFIERSGTRRAKHMG